MPLRKTSRGEVFEFRGVAADHLFLLLGDQRLLGHMWFWTRMHTHCSLRPEAFVALGGFDKESAGKCSVLKFTHACLRILIGAVWAGARKRVTTTKTMTRADFRC